MSGQFVFEIEFKGKNITHFHPEKQLIIVDEGSISDFSKLKEDLSKCTSEPFIIQYLDDENDLVSVDTEEEFKEFTKLVRQHCSKGKAIKLILVSNPISDGENRCKSSKLETADQENRAEIWAAYAKKLKMKLKYELKQEILSEMKDELGATAQPNVCGKETIEYEEDSDGNLVRLPEKRKVKVIQNLKKLEKKEKHTETKIDQRLEKLDLKRKKLLEKASFRAANRNLMVDPKVGLPLIISGIAARDSVFLPKRVTVGKAFLHQWRVINDGTVSWRDVQLHHTWSSPGLEPDEVTVKCHPILPGQECQVVMRFRAPKTVGAFVTYWHFVYGSQWTQFGHYVSLTGNTKLPKLASATGGQTKVQDCNKKSKLEKKTVSFNEANLLTHADSTTLDGAFYNEKTFEKQLQASLASAEIAAEMAREAAKAVLRRALSSRMQAKTSDEDQLTKSCQELHLVDSGSETDLYLDVNEETDPGFVIVNIPSCFSTDKSKPTDKNIQTLIVDSVEEKETNVLQNQKVDENIVLPPLTEGTENEDINTNKVMEKGTPLSKEVNEMAQQMNSSPCFNLNSEVADSHKIYPTLPVDQQQPLSFPRLDPNVNYPVFPPPRVALAVYQPQHPMPPQQHPPHGYPVFPPQNSSSHAIVFPPPPMIHFSTPKINPPVHYPQIPSYPPLISSVMPPATAMPPQPLPPQPSMAPGSQITFPQESQPMFVSSVCRFPPHPMFNYAQPSDKTTQQTPIMSEGQAFCVSKPDTPVTSSNLLVANQNVEANTLSSTPQSSTEVVAQRPIINGITEDQSEPLNENRQPDATVQILPQSLVDGAINVAATAYSTAWNALNNLRPKEGEAQAFDPMFENHMALLVEMGFRSVERNARLLKRFNNDINQVIGVICASPGGDNLEID